jgi:PLP dependent protein
MTESPSFEQALRRVRSGIEAAARRAGRDPGGILLVAVTKSVPLEAIRQAREAGLADFGENYATELAAKSAAVPATWHYLGALQHGTAAAVADHAAVVHSARPGRAMAKLSTRAAARGASIRALLQVDFTGRRQGVGPDDVEGAAEAIHELPSVVLVGLMTLPPWTDHPEGARPSFARLRTMRDELRRRWPDVAELSMGMSSDYEVAIEEGATMVRVGTALFGPRPAPDH